MNLSIKIAGTLSLIFLVSFNSKAQRAYLDVGEPVESYPKVEWLQGAPITKFEKDKIYVVELWATWCKPCVAQMPHLNALSVKFKDKITFVGQNIWEEDVEKVKAFLANNKGLITYPVAFGGGPSGASDFDKNWTKPSGTSGIPATFIIQNNTLVYITDPFKLNEAMLQLLVDRKFSVDAANKLISVK